MQDCIFCKIIAGDIPSHKIYEDDNVFAFLDINPVNEGHTLVVPKAHATNMLESDQTSIDHTMAAVRALGPTIRDVVGAGGLVITSNIGEVAGQSVFHTHVHIVPRKVNDGLSIWPQRSLDQGELKQTAENIRAKL